jgi:hypothetical protein
MSAPSIAFPPRRTTGAIALTALVFADMVVLAGLRLSSSPALATAAGQAIFVSAFGALAVIDLPLALTVAIVELAVSGAGGAWTTFPLGVSGRIVLDAIVLVASLPYLTRDVRDFGRSALGRYGAHAVAIALVMAATWIPMGLLFGHSLRDAVQDGDAVLFLAFTIPIVVVMRRVGGAWIRSSLLGACASTAVFSGLLLALHALGVVALWPTMRDALIDGAVNLGFGGQVGIMPDGSWRLYLGSGIYLQVGLALVTWQLLERPRSWLMWLLYALLIVDVIASYTRGFWLASVAAVAIVLVFGSTRRREPAIFAAGTASILIAFAMVGAGFGFSLSDYVFQRAASTLASVPASPSPTLSIGLASPPPGSSGPGDAQSAGPGPSATPSVDYFGEVGNQIRLDQARVLLGHIVLHPLLGEGFGAVAREYAYAQSYRYEISYLDLGFKTGLVGLLLFLSYPFRLLFDSIRARYGRLALPRDVVPHEAVVAGAVVVSILAASVTNPYLLGAYGILPILLAIAWLDPIGSSTPPPPSVASA